MNWLDRSILQATGVALGLMLIGIVAGAFGTTVTFHLAALSGVMETEYGQWITRYGLQYGFFALAVAYVFYRGSVDRFVRIKRPGSEGLVWIVVAPVALLGISLVFNPILGALGIGTNMPELAADPTDTFLQFAVFFVVAWLVAAPAEELLFRGVIQGRLRETMGPVGAVTIAAIIFALMHVLFGVIEGQPIGAIVGWGIETLVSGLVFGAAYERTKNLVVPSMIHATMWTLPYFVVI